MPQLRVPLCLHFTADRQRNLGAVSLLDALAIYGINVGRKEERLLNRVVDHSQGCFLVIFS